MIVLMSSGILRVFDTKELSKSAVIVGVGFLVGYFSDSAIGKLTEIANTLFGSNSPRHANDKNSDGEEL